ncbi:MAG: hypothetical protein AAF798_23135 [Bacteroidota bacterium]
MSTSIIQLKIEGHRNGQILSPQLLDVNEVIDLLTAGRDFLFPDKKTSRPTVGISLASGSAIINFEVPTPVAIQAHALLDALNDTRDLGLLTPRQEEGIRSIHKLTNKNSFTAHFGAPNKAKEGLSLDKHVTWQKREPIWIEEELYITGEIVDIGGKTVSNIHLVTKDLGALTVASSRAILSNDPKNRLYKRQEARIKIKRNLQTGDYDNKSAILVEFIDHDQQESPDAYLDRLIQESAPYWQNVEHPEEWLKQTRGYE